MSDWWSKKLSGQRPTPSRPVTTPPTTPPIRIPQPQQESVSPPPPQQQGGKQLADPSQPANAEVSFSQALRNWSGGEASRNNLTCPDCGSIYVFTRTGRGTGTMVNGATPAPRCYECGWNGLYDQASQGNWGV